jgi:hypothetical protein
MRTRPRLEHLTVDGQQRVVTLLTRPRAVIAQYDDRLARDHDGTSHPRSGMPQQNPPT